MTDKKSFMRLPPGNRSELLRCSPTRQPSCVGRRYSIGPGSATTAGSCLAETTWAAEMRKNHRHISIIDSLSFFVSEGLNHLIETKRV
jgi:hypothetical protein